jgi:hypothetical protein
MSAVWKVEGLEVIPSFEGKSEVVKVVHWRASATRNAQSIAPLHATAYGSALLSVADLSEFTPFDELTEAQVVAWVKDRINAGAGPGGTVAQIESSLETQLDELENPPIQAVPPPWSVEPNQ